MGKKISISQLSAAVMEAVREYADTATEEVKQAVTETGDTVQDEIRRNAPKDTGRYARSWTVKKTKETSQSLTVTVHSKDHYQLAHLLEFGHAKRGGGGLPHSRISPRQKNMESKRWKRSSAKHWRDRLWNC